MREQRSDSRARFPDYYSGTKVPPTSPKRKRGFGPHPSLALRAGVWTQSFHGRVRPAHGRCLSP